MLDLHEIAIAFEGKASMNLPSDSSQDLLSAFVLADYLSRGAAWFTESCLGFGPDSPCQI